MVLGAHVVFPLLPLRYSHMTAHAINEQARLEIERCIAAGQAKLLAEQHWTFRLRQKAVRWLKAAVVLFIVWNALTSESPSMGDDEPVCFGPYACMD
jgi:hypothetical protein